MPTPPTSGPGFFARLGAGVRALFGSGSQPAGAPPPGPASAQPAVASPAGAPRQAAEAEPETGMSFGVRRPLLDRKGSVAGFEFSLPEALANRARQQGDLTALAAHCLAMFSGMRQAIAAGQVAVAALPVSVLGRPRVLPQVPVGAMIAITDEPDIDGIAAIAAMRSRGVRVGATRAELPGAQFLLVDASPLDSQAFARLAESARQDVPERALVVVGLPDIDAVEAALAGPAELAAGRLDRRQAPRRQDALPPQVRRVSALMNQVLRNADLKLIADELRADVGLSYQLLRHVNSAWLGLPRPAQSVDDAVMLIGRDGLFRWLTLMLMSRADSRPTSRALQEIALARGRLMELLAQKLSLPSTPLFTTGLLSLLDVMLRADMADALEPLHLPAPAVQALVGGEGPWQPVLELARALERRDLESAETLAEPFGGLSTVGEMAEQAWQWSREVQASTLA